MLIQNQESENKYQDVTLAVLEDTQTLKNHADLLIVDDNIANLTLLFTILSQQGYKVRKALGGEAALKTIFLEPPDLILLDIKMPGIDGYAVCTQLKASPQTREIPIIFLSALDEAVDKIRAFEVGGEDYITKPFLAEEVLIRIRYQLNIQKQRQQLKEHNRLLQKEIQERKQAEAATQLLLTTIHAVHQASDFKDALKILLCMVRQAIDWDYGEGWILDDGTITLQLSQTCHDPMHDLSLMQFHQARLGITFTDGVGLLGRVWVTQQSEWIEDVSQKQAPVFLRTEAANRAGLKAAFGVPIVLQEQVLAVLVFFKRSPLPYDPKLVQLVNAVAIELAEFIQRKQTEEALIRTNHELQRLATLDGLTQVNNRRCFDEVLEREWQRLQRRQAFLALIMCDIDYFKFYNDCYGHVAGDNCLKEVAHAIVRACKRPADLVARYGGEEFAVLLPETDIEGAICIAQQIRQQVAKLAIPHAGSRASTHVTLSMGIASLIPTPESLQEKLIVTADRALYKAKAQGRDTYHI
ncbi:MULTISPECIES: diguanylate cyclase [Nostocales]|uniref:Diguanylate cyclase n=4 Tax=Nostocales TaxID=1161 RepID=A0A8S9SYS5_9CYAN|nr:diguanylate cyclase [Tolypothrix bouteillei]KAF3884996.1 diguanylate cyclase [Tolypothrix bouteillei VB521301]